MTATFKIEGAKELERALKILPDKLSDAKQKNALAAAARVIVKEAKNRVPVRSGDLKDAIKVKRTTKKQQRRGLSEVVIGFEKPTSRRAHLTEFGTVKSTAKPFMRPAIDARGDEAVGKYKTVIVRELEKISKELAGPMSAVRKSTLRAFR